MAANTEAKCADDKSADDKSADVRCDVCRELLFENDELKTKIIRLCLRCRTHYCDECGSWGLSDECDECPTCVSDAGDDNDDGRKSKGLIVPILSKPIDVDVPPFNGVEYSVTCSISTGVDHDGIIFRNLVRVSDDKAEMSHLIYARFHDSELTMRDEFNETDNPTPRDLRHAVIPYVNSAFLDCLGLLLTKDETTTDGGIRKKIAIRCDLCEENVADRIIISCTNDSCKFDAHTDCSEAYGYTTCPVHGCDGKIVEKENPFLGTDTNPSQTM